ncbi:carboxymuconolactone decarboxylase family protein [Solimonas terrae]|uniref:Carboxymuconolactone decarboxylase family protein n=1 Tax=Solimonas terrae TaxID=1396819 RepID=A0A6M2BT55_9GAMM|nr:carboxymuconolactone decarboxylase family protein [Solimonas terrae]NGY05411.1 carboxymuconolactone decarboxylase family protein [Solimonas terrae]
MSASRIAPLDPPYSTDLQTAFDTVMRGAPPLTLFRCVARNPRMLQRMMAGGLLDRGTLDVRQRELMILRTTARCGAEYEWGVHVAVYADKAGWQADEIAASVHSDAAAACWSPQEQLLLALADALHERSTVDDELWQALSAHFDDAQLIELIMLAGLYHAVSFMANALRLLREGFAPAFPV